MNQSRVFNIGSQNRVNFFFFIKLEAKFAKSYDDQCLISKPLLRCDLLCVLIEVEYFHSRDQHLRKFIRNKRKFLRKKKSLTPTGLVWDTNMANVTS